MQQGEEHADCDGQNYAERDGVIHELGDEKSAEERAEETEAHGHGQREFLNRPAESPEAVGRNAAAHYEQIGKTAHCNGRVYVRKGRGKGNGIAVDGYELYAEQLEQRAETYVAACGKYVAAQNVVAVGAAALSHAVKEGHKALYAQLELAGDILETGYCKYPYEYRRKEQNAGDYHRRNRRGIYRPAEEIYLLLLVQNGILEFVRNAARPLRRADEYGPHERDDEHQSHRRQYEIFFTYGFFDCIHRPLRLRRTAADVAAERRKV